MDCLKQVHPVRYHALALICELWIDMDERAWVRADCIMEQIKAAEGAAWELTEKNHMG